MAVKEMERSAVSEPLDVNGAEYGDVVARFSETLAQRLGKAGGDAVKVQQAIDNANAFGLYIGNGNQGSLAARPSPEGDGSMEVVRMSANTFDDSNETRTLTPPADSYASKR